MIGSVIRLLRRWYHRPAARAAHPSGAPPARPEGWRRPRHRKGETALALLLIVALFWGAPLAAGAAIGGYVGRGDRFNLLNWEVVRLVGTALHRSAGVVTRRMASNAELQTYFDLLRHARALRRAELAAAAQGTPPADDGRQALLDAAARLRPAVEARYAQALGNAARRAGLVERLPLFSAVSLVWPPVAAGFSVPPHILIRSPRERIALESTALLRSDLSTARAEQIEREAAGPQVSALVDQIGGLGAYPSIVDQDDSPIGLMQTVAHEWTHEYLAFHPLGARYAVSGDLTLINETVADLVGRELGGAAFDDLGLPPSAPPAPTPRSAAIDFNRTLHDLRVEVDALLQAGRIDEAERRMDETQRLLAANGYAIRKINQAYFAFYGSYGANPASSSPLGGKIADLRRESAGLAEFVHRVQTITRPADLDRLLRGG